MKGILLFDTSGRKYDGAVKSAIKKYVPGVTPYSQTNVLAGELVADYWQADQRFNYRVYNDPNVLLYCQDDDVSPLVEEDFLLLEGISRPADRIEAFRHQLEFGMALKEGSRVTVTLPGANLSAPKRARAVVHYKGKVGNQPGHLFGVEILDKTQRRDKAGLSDGTFQHNRYFTCEDGCGLFVSLRWLSPVEGDGAGTSLDRTDRQRGDKLQPSYSQVTASGNGGPSQNTRSRSKPPLSKAASTDGSPSATPRSQHTPPYAKSASRDDALSSPKSAPSKGKTSESSVDPAPPRFVVGQYVMFYDKNGDKHYGTVGWTGRKTVSRSFAYTVVGIRTDDEVLYKSDYENSLPGMDHLISAPKKHSLFLPEPLVENIPKAGGSKSSPRPGSESSPRPGRSDTAQELAGVLDMSEDSLMKEHVEALKEVEKEAAIEAMKAAEQSIDFNKQQAYYEQLQAESAAKGQLKGDQNAKENPAVSQQQEDLRRFESQKRAQDRNNAGDGLGDHMGDNNNPNAGKHASSHIYDEPEQFLDAGRGGAGAPAPYDPRYSPSSQHRQIHQKQHDGRPAHEQVVPYDQGVGGQPGDRQPGHGRHQETSFGQEPSTHGYPPQNAGAEHNLGYQQDRDQYHRGQQPPPQHMRQDFPPGQNQTIPGAGRDPRTEYQSNLPGENRDFSQAPVFQSSQGPSTGAQGHPFSAQGPPPGADGQSAVHPSGLAASTGPPPGEDLSHGLGVGSLIQIPAADGSVKYGTIKWIGLIANVQGKIAGIELEEPMDQCTDGTFQATGQKFFNCPHGMGLYYPLQNVKPDQRWAPQVAADGNPLRKVRSEELDTPAPGNLDMYIGDERGIQGHQNSCYLDATLFGLFAISDEFDAMFLNEKSDIGNTLWRNIVNPLRKNGVVKYECVMRLREQLDQLGQMKGITQDEKDPEEFLNLMFKHTLHVPPFISIRRPFGVENEYFVQLFSEMDGSKEPPSIGNLLEKMFLEQKISFTKVPSKLLIQVPRFGKKFQTFQKIIPAKIINVASIVDVSSKCFFCGEENARRQCPDCQVEFQCDATYCDRCLGLAHQKRPNHNQVGLTKDAFHLKTLADLELLSVICIETSHYVCFTRQEDRWIFFDSMANRVYDKYNIPKVDNCTRDLNSWVYPPDGDLSRLLNTPPRELPEYVRRFTQDIYMCVYIQPDVSMYN